MAYFWTAFDWEAYDTKTADLTMVQDGAYRRLLAHYYKTGRPLPANAEGLLRVCRALADDEKAAVTFVLSRFFTLEADGYHNKRADEELEKAAQVSEKRRDAGTKGALSTNRKKSANAGVLPNHLPTHLQLQPQLQKEEILHETSIPKTPPPPSEFNSTEMARILTEQIGISGREMLWLAQDVIDKAMKRNSQNAEAAAHWVLARWQAFKASEAGQEKWATAKHFLSQRVFDQGFEWERRSEATVGMHHEESNPEDDRILYENGKRLLAERPDDKYTRETWEPFVRNYERTHPEVNA